MTDKTTTEDLPELSDAAISRIETAVFSEIESDGPRTARLAARARSRARRRRWLTGAGVAAAFAAGVMITPPLMNAANVGSGDAAGGGDMYASGSVSEPESSVPDRSSGVTSGGVADASAPTATDDADAGREIIATANVTLQVDDIAGVASAISDLAEEQGGYVESTEVGKSLAIDDGTVPAPADDGYGWISVRIPSDALTATIDGLAAHGDVLSSSISKQDVTTTAVDLRARVDALTASVQRLTELVAQAGSVSELIEAEVALTDRQAELESWQQQLTMLEDQVSMSTLQVQLTRTAEPASADPAGFADGLFAGWNGLVVSLNALVVAVGFILPWVAIAAVVVLVVWLVRRSRRHRAIAEVEVED